MHEHKDLRQSDAETAPEGVSSSEALLNEKVEMIRSSYPNVVDGIGGRYANVPGNQVHKIEVPVDGKPIGINPGTGIIIEGNQEVVTEKIWGCAALYLTNGKQHAFIHMNPNQALPYRPWREKVSPQTIVQHWEEGTARRIADSLKEVDGDKDDLSRYHGVFVINVGHANSNLYSQELLNEDANLFVAALSREGIGSVRIVTLPMSETALYRTPTRPEALFAIGKRQQYDSRGFLKDVPGVIEEGWIPLVGVDSQRFKMQEPTAQ